MIGMDAANINHVTINDMQSHKAVRLGIRTSTIGIHKSSLIGETNLQILLYFAFSSYFIKSYRKY